LPQRLCHQSYPRDIAWHLDAARVSSRCLRRRSACCTNYWSAIHRSRSTNAPIRTSTLVPPRQTIHSDSNQSRCARESGAGGHASGSSMYFAALSRRVARLPARHRFRPLAIFGAMSIAKYAGHVMMSAGNRSLACDPANITALARNARASPPAHGPTFCHCNWSTLRHQNRA